MARDAPPDYYAILEVSPKATAQQIRDAYKRAALKSHPDRIPVDSPEHRPRTARFQLVNDAYYTLSDADRRREYDTQRRLFGVGTSNGYDTGEGASWAWKHFSQATGGGHDDGHDGHPASAEEARKRTGDAQFADVFEEMLREEGMGGPETSQPTGKVWGVVGGLSGGALGFIVGNVPGLVAGAVAGNRLGAIRDTKGKSVYAVFQELPHDDRGRLLSQLAMRVFSHAMGA